MGQITVRGELVLGTLGTLLGLASLITTVVLWRRSGPRVTVEAAVMQLFQGGEQAMTDVVQVTARNTGRAATTIDNWWLQDLSGGGIVVPYPEVKTHELPPPAGGRRKRIVVRGPEKARAGVYRRWLPRH
jgi:hypothetical protein